MVSVKVLWTRDGKPAEGRKVAVSFHGLRGITESQYTDRQGEVHFDVAPGTGEIYVDGSSKHHGRIEGRVVVYI
jgi:hypothetical protein